MYKLYIINNLNALKNQEDKSINVIYFISIAKLSTLRQLAGVANGVSRDLYNYFSMAHHENIDEC